MCIIFHSPDAFIITMLQLSNHPYQALPSRACLHIKKGDALSQKEFLKEQFSCNHPTVATKVQCISLSFTISLRLLGVGCWKRSYSWMLCVACIYKVKHLYWKLMKQVCPILQLSSCHNHNNYLFMDTWQTDVHLFLILRFKWVRQLQYLKNK